MTIGEDLAPICSSASGRHDLRNAAACMTASSANWQRKTKQNFGEKAVSLGAPSAGAYSNSSFPGGEPLREIATRSGTCVPPAGTGLGCKKVNFSSRSARRGRRNGNPKKPGRLLEPGLGEKVLTPTAYTPTVVVTRRACLRHCFTRALPDRC